MTLEDRLRRALRPVHPGDDFAQRVLAKLEAAQSAPVNRPTLGGAPRWAIAASVLLALGSGAFVQHQRVQARNQAASRELAYALELTSRELQNVHRHFVPVIEEDRNMKARHLLALLLIAAPLAAHAQAGRLKLPDFSRLAEKAKESVDISLDGSMLQTASQFMGSSGANGVPSEARQALEGVQGIYVRVFEFEQEGSYSQNDLDAVRLQLQAPGWKKLMSVQSKGEHVDMFMREPGKDPNDGGLAMVISEPKEFVIVNIVGNVDLEKLRQLQGKFGVPALPGGGAPAKDGASL